MDETRLALVVRAPELSDGARVTLLEILFHYGSGTIPSIVRLASLRNVWKSTAQEHLSELKERGILVVLEASNGARKVKLDWERLAKINGFETVESVSRSWVRSTDAGLVQQFPEEEQEALNKPVKSYNPSDMVAYFKIAGARHKATYVESDTTCMAPSMRKYGKTLVHKMIDHYAMQHKHMRLAYSVANFCGNTNRMIGKVTS